MSEKTNHPSDTVRVLFVDDEPHVLDSMRRTFRNDPWELGFARSGHEALETFDQIGGYDVVVTDQRMPGMTGVELLRHLRQSHPKAVRVILTSHADLDVVLDAINEGFVYKFLTKSCSREVLHETVAEIAEAVRLAKENRRLVAQMEAQADEITAIDWLMRELDTRETVAPRTSDLARAFEALPVAAVVLGPGGAIASANRQACRVLGVDDPQALTGKHLSREHVCNGRRIEWRESAIEGSPGVGTTVCVFWEDAASGANDSRS